ncbi:hypothetical protein LNKW23_45760 [Paralimibaculum aggregatum]|uniref:Uncharacterized protein n=1 Tax=Paralimibaculum aggregatum TaxID=3036245 RepID=A0ABQ6LTH6_9RHOB|nr:hypothetical protein [Limibaculum sp. NKW23]GMG85356.1 hypothetical protein LNKW23_45760 [Limibaculum sp. NKW23]
MAGKNYRAIKADALRLVAGNKKIWTGFEKTCSDAAAAAKALRQRFEADLATIKDCHRRADTVFADYLKLIDEIIPLAEDLAKAEKARPPDKAEIARLKKEIAPRDKRLQAMVSRINEARIEANTLSAKVSGQKDVIAGMN